MKRVTTTRIDEEYRYLARILRRYIKLFRAGNDTKAYALMLEIEAQLELLSMMEKRK